MESFGLILIGGVIIYVINKKFKVKKNMKE